MIEFRSVPDGKQQTRIKGDLERQGYRAADYWARLKQVTPSQLQRFAEEDLIHAIRLESGKGFRFKYTWFYTKHEVNKAIAILYSN